MNLQQEQQKTATCDNSDRPWLETPSARRVMQAINFERPDRLPRWDNFGLIDGYGLEFVSKCRKMLNLPEDADLSSHYNIDVSMCIPDDSPFRIQAGVVEDKGDEQIVRTGWGILSRVKEGGFFFDPIENALENPGDLDKLSFESPDDLNRFESYMKEVTFNRVAGRLVFTKIGGVYCRSQFLRREDRLLMDMVCDPPFVKALFIRVGEYLTQIGLKALELSDSWPTGLWVYDDCANNLAPMFSPSMWEQYLMPVYKQMIQTLRQAGCKHFYFHSDGNIEPLIDLLLEAGFEGFNPLEPRCIDLRSLRERLGNRGVFFGGSCNTQILPGGNTQKITDMVKSLAELGQDGGLIVGSASIGDDISPQAYDTYIAALDRYADYS